MPLIEEIFSLVNELRADVTASASESNMCSISREFIEERANENDKIKDHVAKEVIINRVYFDV